MPIPGAGGASTPAKWGANVGTADGTTFEAGIGGWGVGTQTSAVAQSNGTTDPAYSGTKSLKMSINTNAAGYLAVTSSDFPVAASTTYYFQGWLYTTASSMVVKFDFDYYQSNGTTYISSLAAAVPNTSLVASTWTKFGPVSFTTPALTGFVRPIPVAVSGFANGNTRDMDDLFMGRLLIPSDGLAVNQTVMRASLR